jgi:hypothetical protein
MYVTFKSNVLIGLFEILSMSLRVSNLYLYVHSLSRECLANHK